MKTSGARKKGRKKWQFEWGEKMWGSNRALRQKNEREVPRAFRKGPAFCAGPSVRRGDQMSSRKRKEKEKGKKMASMTDRGIEKIEMTPKKKRGKGTEGISALEVTKRTLESKRRSVRGSPAQQGREGLDESPLGPKRPPSVRSEPT